MIKDFQPKLRTYCRFKFNFSLENYVLLFQKSLRANFSRLRLSAHSLMIEKGRHFTKKIPVENRLCKLCNFNEIEDEFHFMIKCSYYNNLRDVIACYVCRYL